MTLTDMERRALDAVDDAAMVELLTELIRIPSVTGTDAEHDVQHRLARQLDNLDADVDLWKIDLDAVMSEPDFPGMEADRDEGWGLVATLPGATGGPSLILCGHSDVVPPGDLALWQDAAPYSARVTSGPDGDVVHGRGACDMKAGLAANLAAVRALRSAGIVLAGDLSLHCVAGEEDGGLGAFATLRRGHRGDAVVITEPTSGAAITSNGGSLGFTLHVQGRAAHGSTRYEGHSALDAFLPVHAALAELEASRQHDAGALFADYRIPFPISVGRVRCGDWASSVPDRLTAEGRFGLRVGEDPGRARSAFEDHLAAACRSDAWLARHPVRVTWDGGQFASGAMPSRHPMLDLVQGSVADVRRGVRPPERGAPYGSDLRLYAAEGVPGLQYGPGDVRMAHAPREQVPVREMVTTVQMLVLSAMRFCGVAG